MELLSPAGSFDALRAAVQNGADAVYLAGSSFGARRSAKNFDENELKRAVAYAHLRGVRVYVTVNTLIHDAEMEHALFFLHYLYQIGADAVIVQDPALGMYVRKHLPDMHVHASTQMAIHDINGVKALEQLGFHRVVLARELSQKQIRAIRNQSKIELEVFGHGALCESCSGQCLMSSFLGGRSGNRGACAQPCRLPYELYDGENKMTGGYLLSPKDLSLADKLCGIEPDLFDSLKIEGRLKAPQYVGTVTKIYRNYIDHPAKLSSEDHEILLAAFNRSGFTGGYFTGKLGRDMMSYETPGNQAQETDFPPFVRSFFREAEKTWKEGANIRKVPITVHAILKEGEPFQIILCDFSCRIGRASGTLLPEKAQKVALDLERLKSQACRLGATIFEAERFTCELEDGLSIPISEINAVRREAVEILEGERTKLSPDRGKKKQPVPFSFSPLPKREHFGQLTASVETREQLSAVCEYDFARLYVPASLYEEAKSRVKKAELVLRCPDIIREHLPKAEAVLAGNLGYFSLLSGTPVYGDFRLNVFNRMSAQFHREMGAASLTLSLELTRREMDTIAEGIDLPLECIVYGRMPMMLLRNCPFRAFLGSCPKDCGSMYLKDRMGERFYKTCDRQVCTLLNAKPVYLADVFAKAAPRLDYYRLAFTLETAEECSQIINEYQKAILGKTACNPFGENQFTRGHFMKGVL